MSRWTVRRHAKASNELAKLKTKVSDMRAQGEILEALEGLWGRLEARGPHRNEHRRGSVRLVQVWAWPPYELFVFYGETDGRLLIIVHVYLADEEKDDDDSGLAKAWLEALKRWDEVQADGGA